MLDLIGTGVIAVLLGFVLKASWTHPERPYGLRGAALGTVRAAQTVMVIGLVLVLIGVIASAARLF